MFSVIDGAHYVIVAILLNYLHVVHLSSHSRLCVEVSLGTIGSRAIVFQLVAFLTHEGASVVLSSCGGSTCTGRRIVSLCGKVLARIPRRPHCWIREFRMSLLLFKWEYVAFHFRLCELFFYFFLEIHQFGFDFWVDVGAFGEGATRAYDVAVRGSLLLLHHVLVVHHSLRYRLKLTRIVAIVIAMHHGGHFVAMVAVVGLNGIFVVTARHVVAPCRSYFNHFLVMGVLRGAALHRRAHGMSRHSRRDLLPSPITDWTINAIRQCGLHIPTI